MKKISKSAKETAEIAKTFINKILKDKKFVDGATVICLSGDLGAGKTAFTQGVAKYLGVKNKIVSPTFIIFKKYSLKTKKYKYLYHVDAYRLKNKKELLSLGWKEIISNKDHLVFIEWPENINKAIPKNAEYIYISHGERGKRILEGK